MARSAPPLFERFHGRARKLVDVPDKLVGPVTRALHKATRLGHRPMRSRLSGGGSTAAGTTHGIETARLVQEVNQ